MKTFLGEQSFLSVFYILRSCHIYCGVLSLSPTLNRPLASMHVIIKY